jgi:hypothetical protein
MMNTFKPFNIADLPNSVSEIKANPPTSWTRTTEQIFTRCMAFSECEMISHPIIILTVVSTMDHDPVIAMQELSTVHHTPTILNNGQYDNTIHRIFVLLEDISEKNEGSTIGGKKPKDPLSILRSLNSYFPPAYTKLLSINSFSASSPNLQQPDMWSHHIIPKFFSSHTSSVASSTLPINPMNGKPILGARLSVDDFMKIREFCFWLYSDQILPILERKLNYLHKQINESRRGVKNVLKSFWRKPKEDSPIIDSNYKGGNIVKYRYDKIESQTLLLADLSFMLKDYETASSMYKLVKDDFKSDKSILHLCHCLLMSAICNMITEPNKYRDVYNILEQVSLCMTTGFENSFFHAYGYFALLCSEVYVLHPNARSPLDSARILLQASSALAPKYPLLSALLVERASFFFLSSNQVKKYVLHVVIAGMKFRKIGKLPACHATICFTVAVLLVEKGNWGDLKSKMMKALSDDLKNINSSTSSVTSSSPSSSSSLLVTSNSQNQKQLDHRHYSQRSLLFLLKMLTSMLKDDKDVGITTSLIDAVSVLNEIMNDNSNWGTIRIHENWNNTNIRDILLSPLPISPLDITAIGDGDITKSRIEVYDLPVPEIHMSSVTMIEPINGYIPYDIISFNHEDKLERLLLISLLKTEREWIINQQKIAAAAAATAEGISSSGNSGNEINNRSLEECMICSEKECRQQYEINSKLIENLEILRIPKGERLLVKMTVTNKLPIDIIMQQVKIEVNKMFKKSLVSSTSSTSLASSSSPVSPISSKTEGITDDDVDFNEDIEFEIKKDYSITISSDSTQEIVLEILPKYLGSYHLTNIRWKLSEFFTIIQPIRKKGNLLQKTLSQRANYERTKESLLKFTVIESSPLISMKFEGLSSEILQGQLLKSYLIMKNVGTAMTQNIFIKLSQPSFVFYLAATASSSSSSSSSASNSTAVNGSNNNNKNVGKFLDFYGHSSTIVNLDGISIEPGEEIRIEAWLRLTRIGPQKISLLASYEGPQSTERRHSYVSVKVCFS